MIKVLEMLTGMVPAPRTASLRTLRHPQTKQPLDQALVLYFKAPASETGEDTVELQLHGGRAVIAAVLEALSAVPGCRMAEPGEFARRAFYNGKIDLTAAEGLADLIDAETEAQRAQALQQTRGALAQLYNGWRSQLVEAQALVEADIDFSDEGDVGSGAYKMASASARDLQAAIATHLGRANRGEILRSGFKVVLSGAPNAGKSSLLNALARRDAAIVSDEPGTTRDVIEVRLDLDGIPVVFSDTAGVREPTGTVEREGIRRTFERAEAADLVIWLIDALKPVPPPAEMRDAIDPSKLLLITNKIDLLKAQAQSREYRISARTGGGIDHLAAMVAGRARLALGSNEGPSPTQARHRLQLTKAMEHLTVFLVGDPDDLELRAEDLRLAARALGRLTGRIDPEDVLAEIFGRFCIGK